MGVFFDLSGAPGLSFGQQIGIDPHLSVMVPEVLASPASSVRFRELLSSCETSFFEADSDFARAKILRAVTKKVGRW